MECRARNATRLKCRRNMTMDDVSKVCACLEKCNSSCENNAKDRKSIAPATQNDMTTCLETFEKERFCSFPHRHGEATLKAETRDETCGNIKNEHFAPDFLQFSYTSCSFKIDVFLTRFLMNINICYLKNRCFVQGFRQFSSHLVKCHTCHGICTLLPLDAALTMPFAKNTQHDTS